MPKITPYLWFENQAEEAVNLYLSIFKNSRIINLTRIENVPGQVDQVLTIVFELDGQEFMALNGGPQFPFTEAISLLVDCESQQEVDYYWDKLTQDGGEPGPCGWLKDKFGLSWQVVPKAMGALLSNPDPEKARRVTEAMLQMQKLDIAALEQAAR